MLKCLALEYLKLNFEEVSYGFKYYELNCWRECGIVMDVWLWLFDGAGNACRF